MTGKRRLVANLRRNAKSLVKHLLQADLSKRYGNLKNGVNDIKGHRFFNGMNWTKLLKKELDAPYVPALKGEGDTSIFSTYPDSDTLSAQVKQADDPFLEW